LCIEHHDWLELYSGKFDGDRMLPLLSGSMADTLLPGDILTIHPLDGKEAHVGDIVVFRDGYRLIAHRLIVVFRLGSLTLLVEKGDANPIATIIQPDCIVGRVKAASRGGRLIFNTLPEMRARGRNLAAQGLRQFLVFAARDFAKRMLGRHA
jgi:signal peptidase I